VREPHKWRLPAALWPPLDYKMTFIPHAVTFIQSVTNTPAAPVFLQDLIYVYCSRSVIQTDCYLYPSSIITTCGIFHVHFYAGFGSNYYKISWNFTMNLTMFISTYDFNRHSFLWSNLVHYSSWQILDKNRFIAEMVLVHKDNLTEKVKAAVSINT